MKPGGNKRQKEKEREEYRQEKAVRREKRRQEKNERAQQPRKPGEDPDLAGIIPQSGDDAHAA